MPSAFGSAFALLRSQANKKQSEIAAAAGINPSYLAAIEKGRKPPPVLAKLSNLIAVLNLPESEQRRLRTLATSDRLIDAVNAIGLSEEEPVQRLVRLLPIIASFNQEQWELAEQAICKTATVRDQERKPRVRKENAMDP